MKNISNWLLTGAVLALAFGCQTKKSDDQDKQKQCGHCNEKSNEQSSLEKSTPVAEPEAEASAPAVFEEESALDSEESLSFLEEEVAPSFAASESPIFLSELTMQDPLEFLSSILEAQEEISSVESETTDGN